MQESFPAVKIAPLTPENFSDLAALFEEGGDPRWCWCAYFVVRGLDWSNSTPAANRALLRERVERPPFGHPPGLVALRDGRAVGWVSLGPREGYVRLAFSKLLAPVDERPVWSIVCFVVSRGARGQGVAAALLAGAVEYARAAGASTLEGYPVDTGDGRIPAANAYHGTLSMFETAGFEVVATRRWNATTKPRIIVRRELASG
jgi:GNAT superfamily N-acetyltransferase